MPSQQLLSTAAARLARQTVLGFVLGVTRDNMFFVSKDTFQQPTTGSSLAIRGGMDTFALDTLFKEAFNSVPYESIDELEEFLDQMLK